MTRFKAAGIHLLASVLVLAALGIAMVFAWYGVELFGLMGAGRLLTLLVLISLSAGPLLTLLVYRPGKKHLALDLSVVVLLQLAFLVWGVFFMWQSRPVFLVGVLDRFELVFASELDAADLAQASPTYRKLTAFEPRVVGARGGSTPAERLAFAVSGLAGKDVQLFPSQYVPYEEVAAELLSRAQPLETFLDGRDAGVQERVARWLSAAERTTDSVVVVPITSRRGAAAMLLDAATGIPVGPIGIDPWARDTK